MIFAPGLGVEFHPFDGRDDAIGVGVDTLRLLPEVARFEFVGMGVSPITARLWCRRGLFPNAYELQTPRGPVWMIPQNDLEGFEPPKKTGRPPKAKRPA